MCTQVGTMPGNASICVNDFPFGKRDKTKCETTIMAISCFQQIDFDKYQLGGLGVYLDRGKKVGIRVERDKLDRPPPLEEQCYAILQYVLYITYVSYIIYLLHYVQYMQHHFRRPV